MFNSLPEMLYYFASSSSICSLTDIICQLLVVFYCKTCNYHLYQIVNVVPCTCTWYILLIPMGENR